MRKFTSVILGLTVGVALSSAASAAPFNVRYESESVGLQETTATFSSGGVETFESLSPGLGQTYTSNFSGTGPAGSGLTGTGFSGVYSDLQINNADWYGGAGGVGKYPVAFSSDPYTLTLTTPSTYFGYWLSALDKGNQVTFYSGNQQLFTFTPANVIASIAKQSNPSAYYGNPNASFQGQDSGEPFVFLDFFANGGTTFDKIVFSEVNFGGGYESDNHTVGTWVTQGTGTSVPLGVPEPSTWLLMLVGLGAVGAMIRASHRQPRTVATQA